MRSHWHWWIADAPPVRAPPIIDAESSPLSFDEVIVTTFTAGRQATPLIWMLGALVQLRQRSVTNVAAVFVIGATQGTEAVAGGGK